MKTYLVGGAVRDLLLGLEPKDCDYVVVGSTPEEMGSLGYKQVGLSFPVFLHPETGDEYALARKERKTGPGYSGFEVDFDSSVTLEEDLSRRDLTINSIAMDLKTKEIIDPFCGQEDLTKGLIRHTSEAFSEDPLRVMRVARFAARYGFAVESSTTELCRRVVKSGEFDAITAERIWVEMEKLFEADQPSLGMDFLEQIGAFNSKRLGAFVDNSFQHYNPSGLEMTTTEKMYFLLDIHDMTPEQCQAYKVPAAVHRETRFLLDMFRLPGWFSPGAFVAVFDKFRPEMSSGGVQRFINLTHKTDFFIRADIESKLQPMVDALLALDFTDMVKGMKGPEIKEFVLQKKIDTVHKIYNATF